MNVFFDRLAANEWLVVGLTAVVAFVAVYLLAARRGRSTPPRKKVKTNPTGTQAEKPETPAPNAALPKLAPAAEEEAENDPTKVGSMAKAAHAPLQPPTQTIVADDEAAVEEPTRGGALILITGMAQTDKGLRRKRNEDSILALPQHGVYAVADGMGGYRGGEIASALAVKSIAYAFDHQQFDGPPHEKIPKRASELARAIQMANEAVLRRSESDPELKGMGTTVCAARFSPNKQRLYIGHVGDSRMYRLRDGKLTQLTKDHTMKDLGVTGDAAAHLSRAIGIWPTVPVDVILCKPRPRDMYLLCSDGLNKMLKDSQIATTLNVDPHTAAAELIAAANASGGKDNISVIVIRVDDPLAEAVNAGREAAPAS